MEKMYVTDTQLADAANRKAAATPEVASYDGNQQPISAADLAEFRRMVNPSFDEELGTALPEGVPQQLQ